ncbi:MAG: sulfotransferase [Tunicatimonas sp.]|uniref:sulfotransferase n=1 Tax=Tunicatimonas sp. TaxID=1940096 RepID=UPI003C778FB6
MNTEHITAETQSPLLVDSPVVFHIGWMRTGTTFLQGVFKKQENIQLSLKNRFISYNPYYSLGREHYRTLVEGSDQHQVVIDSDENYAMGRFKTHLRKKNQQRSYNYKAELSFVYHDIPEMLSRMKEMSPNAKILGVIRKQADWFESVYKHDVYHFGLDQTFEKFYQSNLGQAYRNAADYSGIIASFQQAFGKDNVKILLFEDFIQDQQKFVKNLSDFLEVDILVGEKKSLKKNASTSGLITHLHRMANTLAEPDPRRPERKLYQTLRTAIYKLDRIAATSGWKLSGKALSTAMQQRISRDFAASNEKLIEIIGDEALLKRYQYIK